MRLHTWFTKLRATRFDTRVGGLAPSALLYRQQGEVKPTYWSVLMDMSTTAGGTRGKAVAVVRWEVDSVSEHGLYLVGSSFVPHVCAFIMLTSMVMHVRRRRASAC